jgi:chromate transporter
MRSQPAEGARPKAPDYTFPRLFAYFLRLGTLGFGGPIALVGYMQRDLVEERGWITEEEYKEGLALAQLAPGPLAAQLAIYLGWVRAGVAGASAVGAAFVAPSFVMVVVLAALYLKFGGLSWMQGAFYGVGAAVIGIIVRSTFKLVRLTLVRDRLLWALFLVNTVVTGWKETEIVWVFLVSGLVAVLVKRWPLLGARSGASAVQPWWLVLLTGLHGAASFGTLATIAWYFTQAGAFVFGSGLAIVPFLRGGVVDRFHWLDDRQFLDAVAVAMITPGPVVITVGFIGYLVAGLAGATVAALGTFVPCYLLVVLPARSFQRWAKNLTIKAFVDGVTAAATGAIAGAAFVLARRAIVDVPAAIIAAGALGVLLATKKVPEPVLIAISGVVGVVLQGVR